MNLALHTRTGNRRFHGLSMLFAATVFGGCTATAPINPRVEQVNLHDGYRIQQVIQRKRTGQPSDTLVILAFSGGGTRAAAFSYGVLEELRRHSLPDPHGKGTWLDAVDVVTGVSGGSFTALGYALHGPKLFEVFESQFLKRDIQGELLKRSLTPGRWTDLASQTYGRSELAADYYDEILFKGATFADLVRSLTPVAMVSGTDISTGGRFDFTQETFDLLCSDLSQVRLARAAAASSAVPVVLSPVTFHNYGGRCGAPRPAWLADINDPDNGRRPAGRALLRQRDIDALEDSVNRPYIHVVDGGISDNLGLRGVLEAFEKLEASPNHSAAVGVERIRNILVIVVNARSAPSTDWDRSRSPPGMIVQLFQSSSVPIDRYSYESMELLKDLAQRWSDKRRLAVAELRLQGMTQQEAEARVPAVNFDAIDIGFDAIDDPVERRYFMELPTTFRLPDEAVDRLREVAGRLLRTDPRFKSLMQRAKGGGR